MSSILCWCGEGLRDGAGVAVIITAPFLPRRSARREQSQCAISWSSLAPVGTPSGAGGPGEGAPFTPGLGCGGGCLRAVFRLPRVTGLWDMLTCQPPGLHGHWLPFAERALHTALTCQPLPAPGTACLYAQVLPLG